MEAPRPAPQIEHIDHTADIGVVVRAATAKDAFIAAAGAMLDYMVERDKVPEAQERNLEVTADGWEDLLVTWLEELLYLFESERFVPKRIELAELSPDHLRAHLHGDTLDAERDETKIGIKAVTYHQLRAEETEEGFVARVIFDS